MKLIIDFKKTVGTGNPSLRSSSLGLVKFGFVLLSFINSYTFRQFLTEANKYFFSSNLTPRIHRTCGFRHWLLSNQTWHHQFAALPSAFYWCVIGQQQSEILLGKYTNSYELATAITSARRHEDKSCYLATSLTRWLRAQKLLCRRLSWKQSHLYVSSKSIE